jgi:hypothetical protein
MTGAMSAKLMKMCSANWNSYGADLKLKGIQWMKTFEKEPDDLMETAIISCFDYCKEFPTIADVKEVIREIQRDKRLQPKLQQLASNPKWKEPPKVKEYDYNELYQYAKLFFSEITMEQVKLNDNEINENMQTNNCCHGCGYTDGNCPSGGYHPVMYMRENGRIQNDMMRCEKKREYTKS